MNLKYFTTFAPVVIIAILLLTSCHNKKGPLSAGSPDAPTSIAECKQCIVLAEQSEAQVIIADAKSKKILWQWKPQNLTVKPEHVKWFSNISDAKPVYNGEYILISASGGGVALVRINDKKTIFYAYAGGNTHSVELLPDGNIVSASSTGNYLTVFKVDTLNFPENVYKKNITIHSGHNVVWDHKNQVLWSAGGSVLYGYQYNFNCTKPDLTLVSSLDIPGISSHDLFPVYNENALWLSMNDKTFKLDMATKTFEIAKVIQSEVKSVSSGPADFPIILLWPKVEWWSDEVVDAKGDKVFHQPGLKIYKARWLLKNSFSYPANHSIKQCN